MLNPGAISVITREYTRDVESVRDLPALGAFDWWNPSHQVQRKFKLGRSASPLPP